MRRSTKAYHINNDGKIYECKAYVFPCPYGADRHAKTEEELYHRMLNEEYSEIKPSIDVVREVDYYGRLINYKGMTEDLENTEAPIEVILANLAYAKKAYLKAVDLSYVPMPYEIRNIHDTAVADAVYCEAYGLTYPRLPSAINAEVMDRYKSEYKNRLVEDATFTRDPSALSSQRRLRALSNDGFLKQYNDWDKNKLSGLNQTATITALDEEIEMYSKLFNTSKLIALPIFPVNPTEAKEVISNLDDDALQAAYEASLMTDKEVQAKIKDVNYFKLEQKPELTARANRRMQMWSQANARLYELRNKTTAKRVHIAFMLAKELDERGLSRVDASVRGV